MFTTQIKKFTAKANDSQIQTKMFTAKGKPDLRPRLRPKDPWISRTLKTKRSSPFQIKNLLNANGVIKILRSLYGAQSSGWEREY